MTRVALLERLRREVSYNAETGVFTRLRTAGGRRAGTRAGFQTSDGYRALMVGRVLVYEHQAAWALTYGSWPEGQIDHKDRQSDRNVISNLRPASNGQNAANRPSYGGAVPYKGVYFNKSSRRFQAYIQVEGRKRYLGLHDSPEAAARAYNVAAIAAFGDFAFLNELIP